MVREDILGILKTAIQKGKNLQQTAQSLINAGYPEAEVTEASKSVESYVFQPTQIQRPASPKAPVPRQQFYPGKSPQVVSQYYSPAPVEYIQRSQQVVQRVSGYNSEGDRAGKAVTIIMVIILAVLIGILLMVFLFKDELMSIINNL